VKKSPSNIAVAPGLDPSSDLDNALPAPTAEVDMSSVIATAFSRRNFLCGLGALSLSACGGGGEESSAGASVESTTTTTATATIQASSSSAAFVHPGLLHTADDFARMRVKVTGKISPWIDSWNKLIANGFANKGRTPLAVPVIYRGYDGVHPENYSRLYDDVHSAYLCALRWQISGDTAYADEAVRLMNAWSSTLTGFGGTIDWFLAAGIQGYQFANAGEIMRSYSGWAAADFAKFQSMMLNVFYPVNHQGLVQSLAPITVYSSWQLCCIASILAIGVLCDDRAKFDEAVNYFQSGTGNGGVAQTVYYIHPGYLGQTQESGRDQGHNTLSISLLTNICEMAWNQGRDLYGYDNNRVLAGAEYIAKGNLIQSGTTYYSMPFAEYHNTNVADTVFSTDGQGSHRPEWALIYNHYVNRKGLAAPYCGKIMALTAPEGGNIDDGAGAGGGGAFDELGYGTLTCTRAPMVTGVAPSGLTAVVSGGQVILSWWGSASATSYQVWRSTSIDGTYSNIATVTDPLTYADSGLTPGTYFYKIIGIISSTVFTAASNIVQATTAVELHCYLALDEGNGSTAIDLSGQGNNGTLVGGASRAVGKKGSAVLLDGVNGYISLPAGLLTDIADFTVAAWIYRNAYGDYQRVFSFGTGISQYMTLLASTQQGWGGARFTISVNGNTGEENINVGASVVVGQWVHVAVTQYGKLATLYVNGVAVNTNTGQWQAPFRLGNTTQNWIGRSQFDGDPYFNGLVDDFRIYRGALSADRVAALMTPQLQTYLAFDEVSGTTAADSSGNAHVGTLVNGATWAAGKKGNALALNGSNGYVSLPADVMGDVDDFTIAAWVHWNAASNWARIFDFGSGTGRYMMLTPRSGSGTARFAITVNGNGSEQVINSSAPLPTGQWVHVAVTLSGMVGSLYVNGSLVGTNTAMQLGPFRLGSTSQNWIGRSQYSADPYFNGLVDDFRIYRGALDAAQIAALSAA
jgi:hypothetical protein